MKKVVMLSPMVPDPRIMNRVDALHGRYRIIFFFWDRFDGKISIDESKLERVYVKKGQSRGMRVSTFFGYMGFIAGAIRVLRHERPDIIHAYRVESLIAASLYAFFSDRDVKIVYEIADLPSCVFPRGRNLLKKALASLSGRLEKRLIKRASFLVFTSPAFYEYYYQSFAADIPRVIQECVVNPEVLAGYERASGFPSTVTMAFYGNMRYLDSIECAAAAVDSVDKARFSLAGFTQNEKRLKRIVEAHPGTTNSGIFKGGSIGKMYSGVDVIYSAYETEDINARVLLPNKYYEAIMLGLPVIVSEGTYLSELVLRHGIGYAVDIHDTERLARILRDLDEAEMARIKKNCEKARGLYDVAKHNKELLKTYDKYFG